MSQSATPVWFVHTAKGREGPLTLNAVQIRVACLELKPEDLAWCPGMPEWRKIRDLPVLQPPPAEPSRLSISIEADSELEKKAEKPPAASKPLELTLGSGIAVELETHPDIKRPPAGELAPVPAPYDPFQKTPPPTEVHTEYTEKTATQALRPLSTPESEPLWFETPGDASVNAPGNAINEHLPTDAIEPLDMPVSNSSRDRRVAPENSLNEDQLWSHAPAPKKKIKAHPALIAAAILCFLIFGLPQLLPAALSPLVLIVKWLSPIPHLKGMSDEEYELLRKTAGASLTSDGPRVEVAMIQSPPKGSSFMVSTNLPDATRLDARLAPVSESIVGDPLEVLPFQLTIKKHIARSATFEVPEGYYWLLLSPAADQPPSADKWVGQIPTVPLPGLNPPLRSDLKPVLARKLFLGGVPDLGYQTRLKDFAAVRRGKARAEIDSILDSVAKMDALLSAENQAASGILVLKIAKAQEQAWEIYQSTWNKGLEQIENAQKTPARFFPKSRQDAIDTKAALIQLHELHHKIVGVENSAPRPGTSRKMRTSSQLSAGNVASAQIVSDAQAMTDQIKGRLQAISFQMDSANKRMTNPFEGIPQEEFPKPVPLEKK